MTNYIKADMTRIFKRIPRTVLMLITFAAFALAIFTYVSTVRMFTRPEMAELGLDMMVIPDIVFSSIIQIAGYAAGLFGLFELIHVFSDDLKAKTAQIAIGVGVSRIKVIFSKFFELVLLLAMDMVILLGVSVAMSAVLGDMMTGAQIMELLGTLTMGMLISNIAYLSLVLILIFATQSMTLAVLSFLVLKFHMVSGAIGMTEYIKALKPLNLGSYTLTTMLDKVSGMIGGAEACLMPILAVAAYIVGAFLITCFIYRKKELEF